LTLKIPRHVFAGPKKEEGEREEIWGGKRGAKKKQSKTQKPTICQVKGKEGGELRGGKKR